MLPTPNAKVLTFVDSHYIFDLIVNCLYEAEASVQQVFLLIRILINQTRYLAEISLLGVLFLLLPYCTKCPRHDSRHKSLALGLKFFHYGLIFILSTLWVAALPFKIKYTVKFVEYYSYRSYKSDLQNWYKIDTAYSIIVVFGSLLVLSWAITGLLQRSSGSHGRVELLFFTCVAVPFFIRSVYEMAITIRLQLLDKNNSENLLLATNIIYTSTSLAIYTGIVLLGYLFSKDMIHPAGNNVGAFVGPLNPYGLATHNSYYYQGNPPYPGLNSGPKNQMQVHEANMAVPSAYLAQGGQNWPMQSPGHPIYAPLQQQGGYQYPQPGMQQQHYPPAQSYSPVSPINPHEVAGSGVPESRSPPPSGAQANIQPPK
ncbi:MAG: hypothetical protein LQ342_003810 [Letrouitia transgressa]|nr:MAG: hypothetical protein LQ342_003810 [Letrouitia transgressa]